MCLWVTSQSNHLWRLSKHWILAKRQALNCSGSPHKEPSGPTTSSSGYFPNSRMCNWNRHTWDLIGFPNWFPDPWGRSVQLSSVTQSCLTLRPHESQHTRPPCPSPTPGAHSNSCPLTRGCHTTISSSVVPFSSCPQSFLASVLFQWVSSSNQVAKVLEFQLQHQSFHWILTIDFL